MKEKLYIIGTPWLNETVTESELKELLIEFPNLQHEYLGEINNNQ